MGGQDATRWKRGGYSQAISASVFQEPMALCPLARFSFSLSRRSCVLRGSCAAPTPFPRNSLTSKALEGPLEGPAGPPWLPAAGGLSATLPPIRAICRQAVRAPAGELVSSSPLPMAVHIPLLSMPANHLTVAALYCWVASGPSSLYRLALPSITAFEGRSRASKVLLCGRQWFKEGRRKNEERLFSLKAGPPDTRWLHAACLF
jgi:hypothetical protein